MVGKANPGALLQIETSGTAPSQIRVGATGTGSAGIYLDAQDGDFIGSDYASLYQEDTGEVYLKNNGPYPLYLATSNTQRLIIDSAGLIGIGTNTPEKKLHIKAADSSAGLMIERTTASVAAPVLVFRKSRNGAVAQAGDGLANLFISDYISSSTLIDNWFLGVFATETRTATAAGNSLYFRTVPNGSATGLDRMFIGNDGNIGIGTTTPAYTLDITTNNNYIRIGDPDSTGETLIGNGTNTTGYYAPSFYGRPVNPARNTTILSEILPADDTSTNPALVIGSRVTPSTVVSTRPIVAFRNNTRTDMQINADGNVGIGTTTPAYPLEVTGKAAVNALIISNSAATYGHPIQVYGVGGTEDDIIFYSNGDNAVSSAIFQRKSRGTYEAPTAVLTGDYLSYFNGGGHDGVGYYGGGLYQRAEANFTTSAHDTYWYFSNGSGTTTRTTMKIASTGITTIYGTSTCTIGSGTGATSCTSDRRLKKDIQPLQNSLEKIVALQGVSFNWKKTGEHAIGVIAQDVEKQFPEVVTTDEETGMKAVSYPSLVAPLIEAVKSLKAENDALKAELQTLRADVEALKASR